MNHEERFAIQERRIQTIESALKGLPYVTTEHVWERQGHSMHLLITVDEEALGKKHESIQEELRRGDPCILIGMQQESLRVRVHNLMEGEDQVVAERLRQLLSD
jgi:dTDP-4-amino-4,6-dideoxygalactose transaminase